MTTQSGLPGRTPWLPLVVCAATLACSGSSGPSSPKESDAGTIDSGTILDSGGVIDGSGSTDSPQSGGSSLVCTQVDPTDCGCKVSSPGNDTACGPPQITGTAVCCADEGWPAAGTGCDCSAFSCGPTSYGCQCDTEVAGTSTSCTGTTCCTYAAGPSCGCSSAAQCSSNETRVSSCTADNLPCGTGQRRVASCR